MKTALSVAAPLFWLVVAVVVLANGGPLPAQDPPNQDPLKQDPLKQDALKQDADKPGYIVSVAAATDGTIYLADRQLPGIWKLKDGSLEVFFKGSRQLRTPLNAVRCVAVDSRGRVLAGDSATREVYRFDAATPVPLTKGAKGGIGIPMSIALNSADEILVADLELHRIVKLGPDGGEPTLFARVQSPRGVAVDAEGRVLVSCNTRENQVVRLTADGTASEPFVRDKFSEFTHTVALDKVGNAYVVDGYGKCVWKLRNAKEAPAKLVSGPPLDNPVSICSHGDKLLLADPRAATPLFEITLDGKLTPIPLGK